MLHKRTRLMLYDCCDDLRDAFLFVGLTLDLVGHYAWRGEQLQNALVAKGYSRATFPSSAHNYKPSFGFDCTPPYKDSILETRLVSFAELVMEIIANENVSRVVHGKHEWLLTWGGTFSGNFGYEQDGDLIHWELTGWKSDGSRA